MAIFTIKGYWLGRKKDLRRGVEGGSEGESRGYVEAEERWRERERR